MSEDFRSKFARGGMDEILSNPNAFGAPTFEQFKQNKQKYLGSDEQTLENVDKGSFNLREVVDRYVYEIEGFRCKTLEEVERIASDYGIPIKDLDYRPELLPQGGGKAKMLVKFVSKNEREKRSLW